MSLIIYSDGGSRGNPGPSAYAIVVTKDGEIIHEETEFLGINTNNYAVPYQGAGLPVVKIGIAFSREKRTVTEWIIEK